ncbi:unnamed protein product [Mytilus coruscus]|uniref:Integrase catalytic domain-containing protein n=1 Tax=Mytilus coruscus TaxID=42192 RepID=A0A6J8E2C8_MYTCO|nr:unnamed protein product [Mytilus coruscus]
MQVDSQDRFFNEILDMSRKNSSANNSLFSKERIEILIRSVKQAKDATKPTGKERTLLKQYEILTAETLEKLIKRKTSDRECNVDTVCQNYLCKNSGVYYDRANISREAIKTFLKLCDHCSLKKKRSELSKLVIKPVRSSDFSSRGQVDLIDYQSVPDSGYKWVLHYQDHFTKFSILRPLKSKTAAEVAYNLLDIFLILGAPMILQSGNGREFTANIITELTKSLWPDLKIVHGRPRHPQSQGSVEKANADVKEMLATWLSENNSRQWSEGLRFIQFQKNRSYLRVIGQSPYKALFGSEPKVGLSSSSVPRDLLPDIQTEEDLEAIFEVSSVSTDNTDSEYPFSETEHNTDTEIETDKTMSETDIITDTNTETDGELHDHDSADNYEQTIELETETMVIEISDANMADEASISMTSTGIHPHKRAFSGGDIPYVNTSEGLSEI